MQSARGGASMTICAILTDGEEEAASDLSNF
jgi:hypothetical protein